MTVRRCVRVRAFPTALVALSAAVVLTAGCEKAPRLTLLPNQRPRVEITAAPLPGSILGSYSYELSWAGFDTDGRIEHFLWVVDPPSLAGSDTAWTATTLNRRVFVFASDSIAGPDGGFGQRLHTVVLKSVDDRGGLSAPASVSFNVTTIAPTVTITGPVANRLLIANVAPDFRVSWTATDPDGRTSHLPVKLKFRLFGPSSAPGIPTITLDPDTLRRLYAPTFSDWDSLDGSATGVDLHDLQPGTDYILAVVAIDEAGAYSLPFSLDVNVLRFTVSFAATVGPALTVSSRYFSFSFAQGGFYTDPASWIRTQVPADQPTTFQWIGTPVRGTFVTGYRWALDMKSIDDETPRTSENTDLAHWSQWGALGTQTTVPAIHPQSGAALHYLYIEARDNTGGKSLAIVEFNVVRASMERDLLVVNDTRLAHDVITANGCVQVPRGVWPTTAELDTFLFAVGNRPWRCYPAGTVSSPGIFAGYSVDTIGTFGRSPASLDFATLAHYRNLVWMINGEFIVNPSVYDRTPLLRTLSEPGASNPLLIWLGLGGRMWAMGGGIATATQFDWERSIPPNFTYSSSNGELGIGRLLFDFPHWRSEVMSLRATRAIRSARAVGGWAGAPDYSVLPTTLQPKSPTTDPMAPNRTNPSEFYRPYFVADFLTRPNEIVEHTDLDPAIDQPFAALDTLYETGGGDAGIGKPIMTLYHGNEGPPLVYSGFPVWYFQRSQAIQIVDFVLQRCWGLTRQSVPR